MYQVNLVIDVRSVPYSRYVGQFNKEALQSQLLSHDIFYSYRGDLLGARYEERSVLYDDGKVNFGKVRQTDKFINAIKGVINDIKKGDRIALMCSEKDPFDCHRFVLVSYQLEKYGVEVLHVLENGDTIINNVLEERLLHKYKKDHDQFMLFDADQSIEVMKEEAYEERNKDIAYVGTSHI